MTITELQSTDVPTPTGPMRTYLVRPTVEGRYPGLADPSQGRNVGEPWLCGGSPGDLS